MIFNPEYFQIDSNIQILPRIVFISFDILQHSGSSHDATLRAATILSKRNENNLIEIATNIYRFGESARSHHNRWLHDRYRIVLHEIHYVDIANSIVRIIWFDDVLAKESIECQHDVIVENVFRTKRWHERFRYDAIRQQWIVSANRWRFN